MMGFTDMDFPVSGTKAKRAAPEKKSIRSWEVWDQHFSLPVPYMFGKIEVSAVIEVDDKWAVVFVFGHTQGCRTFGYDEVEELRSMLRCQCVIVNDDGYVVKHAPDLDDFGIAI